LDVYILSFSPGGNQCAAKPLLSGTSEDGTK
jgi:hypothetical protein